MGCYDIVILPCPRCGFGVAAQSKSGPSVLDIYLFPHMPEEVIAGLLGESYHCERCEADFKIKGDFYISLNTERG